MLREALTTERFDIVRPVGSGGMGIVYEARERATGERVAVKTLHELDGHALYRLKNEFRQLQGIVHDNLVRLRELALENGAWFLVMDFVDGLDVVSHVRGGARESMPSTIDGKAAAAPSRGEVSAAVDVDHDLVRRLVSGMAAGLHVLHEAGYVHRDIKPSNVLVTSDGRPMVLDFGLVTPQVGLDSTAGTMVGTLPYMAPEQALGHRSGAAADCYALGVVLFEMLTGRWPHGGDTMDIVTAKQSVPAPAPSAFAPATPDDLDRLCARLLDRDPARRPTALEVSSRLTIDTPAARRRRPLTRTSSLGQRFVGRRRELDILVDAMAQTRTGSFCAVWIRGESGVGKSALLQRFAEEARTRQGDAVVLQTRCHENELLPFKAVDGIVDALSAFLRSLRPEDAASLTPRHASLLRVAFPVLARVDAIARAPYPVRPVQDPHERRQRAFAALRELLGRVSERRPLVLVIDDLQWGDEDSVQLLQEALRPPESPALLLVVTSRPEDAAAALVGQLEAVGDLVQRLDLDALDERESTELARQLLDAAGLADSVSAAAIGSEAAGSPLMVQELVRHAATRTPEVHPVLNDAIRLRVARFSPAARDLLTLVCLADAPISMEALGIATALSPVELTRTAGMLVAESLVRSASGQVASIEPYHDRVRQAVVEALDEAERQDLHHRLAAALEGSAMAQGHPELLLLHYRACGRHDVAAEYAQRAARQASEALAFGRASDFLALALSLHRGEPETERQLRIALAQALEQAGRLLESADAFLHAAAGAERQLAFRLRCRALEQILRGGQLERGLDLAGDVLAHIGVRIPRGPRRAILGMLLRRAWLRVRGTRYVEQAPDRTPYAEMEAADVLWSVMSGMVFVDPVVGRSLSIRYTLRALRLGDAYHVSMALGAVACTYATSGMADEAERHAAGGLEAAKRAGAAYPLGMAESQHGLSKYFRGDYAGAAAVLERAAERLRSETTGARWEIDTTEIFRASSLLCLGRLVEADELVSRLLTEAIQCGDQYVSIGLRAWRTNLLWLVRNRPREARRHVEEAQAITRRGSHRFGLHDFYYLNALTSIDLYEGDAAAAWSRLDEVWPAVRRSGVLSVQSVHTEVAFLRLRAALALAARSNERGRLVLLRAARPMARSLRGSPVRDALGALGKLLVTTVEHGDVDAAALANVLAQLDACGLALHAASARLRFGERLGEAGAADVAEARAYMTRERVVDPAALSWLLVPV